MPVTATFAAARRSRELSHVAPHERSGASRGGAQTSDVVRLLARPTMPWAVTGVIAGAAGAVAINTTLRAGFPYQRKSILLQSLALLPPTCC